MPESNESGVTAGGDAGRPAQGLPLDRRRGIAPQRTCVGCRQRGSAVTLVRVVEQAGILVPDDRGQLPGRGAHVHPLAQCLDTAAIRRAWSRALKLSAPPDDSLLRERLSLS